MTPQHHLDAATLMSCSAGSQPDALALIVAAHLAMCPQCRDELAMGSSIGAALFEDVAPVAVENDKPALTGDGRDAHARTAAGSAAVAQGERGAVSPMAWLQEQRSLPWTEAVPGVALAELPLANLSRGHVHLVKLAPGMTLPLALTSQAELTFVVTGGMRTATGSLRTGDVLDGSDAHLTPMTADATAGCVCLMGTY